MGIGIENHVGGIEILQLLLDYFLVPNGVVIKVMGKVPFPLEWTEGL